MTIPFTTTLLLVATNSHFIYGILHIFSEPGGGSTNETGGGAIGDEEYGGIIL